MYAWYTKIIPVEELAKFLTAFPTLIALVLNITIPTVLYRMFINVLKTYKTDVGGVDKANKVLVLYSKLSLLAPIILTLATPIATLLWLGIHSIEKIIACVLGAVGCLNFASLFFYILWTHKLEAYLKFLPFEKKHITMSYILRNMMVSFFLFGALIFLCIDPFIGMLYNGLTLIQTLKMIIPIAILTLSVALFINYTLYKGVNNSINEVMNFTDTLAVGNFIVDKLEIKRRDANMRASALSHCPKRASVYTLGSEFPIENLTANEGTLFGCRSYTFLNYIQSTKIDFPGTASV